MPRSYPTVRAALLVICLCLPSVVTAQQIQAQAPVLQPPADTPAVEPMTFEVGTRTGDPFASLPEGTIRISSFGERPVYSADGRKIAFLGKSYGDVFEYDVATGRTRNLTANFPHVGFLRAHYLPDGNMILLGPAENNGDRVRTRLTGIKLWFFDKSAAKAPVQLGPTVFEGIAVSRRSNLVAWTPAMDHAFVMASDATPGSSRPVMLGTVVVDAKGPRLENVREAFRREEADCTPEAQDFRDNDHELVHACYHPIYQIDALQFATITGIWGARLDRPQLIRYRAPLEGEYSEPEGISPDGSWELVECGQFDRSGLDICRLTLTPDSRDYRRVTRVLDYGRVKVSNPVVSPDGHFIAYQSGKAFEEAGVGHSIFLTPLKASNR